MRHESASAPEYRVVHLNAPEQNAALGYCDNFIVTSKYTLVSFLPKFLFETFRRLNNLYFLIICILQCIRPISNTGGQPSSLAPLLFIIMVDALFAILEDHKRHVADHIANARPTNVLDRASKTFMVKPWAQIIVGDIVKLSNREAVPADILVLAVSERDDTPPCGLCYVETKSLDGETNMKVRSAMECTMATMGSVDHLLQMRGLIRCEQPNNAINSFNGALELKDEEKRVIPYESVILRGCTIRNTDWVHGVVFNTGKDTKIMKSNSAPPSKMSTMDQSINKYTVVLLTILLLFSVTGATGALIWKNGAKNPWYLELEVSDRSTIVDWIVMLFYYLLLMYQFVPISLSVSMSMVKYIQAHFIQWDTKMYHPESDTPALVRSMSLNEELGQISYVFSDKTGTLTCNVMEFRKCSIGGISYGRGTTEIGLAALKRTGKPLPEPSDSKGPKTPYVNFDGPELFRDMDDESVPRRQERIRSFFKHLAICHTVIPERRQDSNEVTLSASSPDEQALVAGASFMGFQFLSRTPGFAHVCVRGTNKVFEVLDFLEFNSARKRMSAIVRHPTGKIMVYTKGADMMVLSRLAKSVSVEDVTIEDATRQHINQYAEEGLRTLTIARRELKEAEYEEWSARFHAAQSNLEEVDKRKNELPNQIDACMDEIETNLELLGATAIEDKLQEAVPTTIANLASAGIKIWILTGDKEETAINIGFACQLLNNDMKLVVINMKNCPNAQQIEEELMQQCTARTIEVQTYKDTPITNRRSIRSLALVIDGEALTLALTGSCRYALATFCQYCKAVIACRVSPAQKAQMVALIKEFVPGVRTLAIGDGANDVSMIQEAHIGVGISGQEGMQAVNSSDYAIARFKFLERLLLVHGRWNYRRMAQLVVYIFYKNILFTAAQYWFTCMSGFSGQKFFLETGVQIYNLALTSIPIIALSTYDRDIGDELVTRFPKLYAAGPREEDLNTKRFAIWTLDALVDSILITTIVIWGSINSGHEGGTNSMWLDGNVVFTMVVLIANIKLMMHQHGFHWFSHVFYIGSFLFWILLAFVSERIAFLSDLAWEQMMEQTLQSHISWPLLVLLLIATMWFSLLWLGAKSVLYPEYWHLAKEVSKFRLDPKLLEWDDISDASIPLPVEFIKVQQRSSTVIPCNTGTGSADPAAASTPKSGRQSMQKRYLGFAFSTDPHSSLREREIASRFRSNPDRISSIH